MNIGWLEIYNPTLNAEKDAKIEANEINATYLFICYIIYVGCGLYVDFIYAWKSGKNPSAISEIVRRKIPMNDDACDLSYS